MATTIKAYVTQVTCGHKLIEGLMSESGRFYIGVPQVEIFANQSKRDIQKFLETFEIEIFQMNVNSVLVDAISIEALEGVLKFSEKIGNNDAEFFRDCLCGLSIYQLFHDAFDPWRNPVTKKINPDFNSILQKNFPSSQEKDKTKSFAQVQAKSQKIFVYLIADVSRGVCKIGVSVNPKSRLKAIQTGYPFPLTLISSFSVKNAFEVEKSIHKHFRKYRLSGEWFDMSKMQTIDLRRLIERYDFPPVQAVDEAKLRLEIPVSDRIA